MHHNLPIALKGMVYCKVDAEQAPIEIGDLWTTSPTPGQAMNASVPVKAFGAVIGKALSSLAAGPGLIPILWRCNNSFRSSHVALRNQDYPTNVLYFPHQRQW